MSDSLEILEATRGVCRRVRHVLVEGREPEQLDCLIFHVEKLHHLLLSLHVTTEDIIEAVAVSLSLLEELNSSTSGACSHGYAVPVLHENSRGRPRFDIKPEQLEYLLTLGLKCPKIAEVLGVSLSTIRRRMTEYGFSVTSLYANITDQELDRIVSEILAIVCHLLSRGLRIHQARVRASLHRVDPDGVVIRWASAVEQTLVINRNQQKRGDAHCMLMAILLKERNREMCGVQTLLSLILFSSRVQKQVSHNICKTSVSMIIY